MRIFRSQYFSNDKKKHLACFIYKFNLFNTNEISIQISSQFSPKNTDFFQKLDQALIMWHHISKHLKMRFKKTSVTPQFCQHT